MFVDFNKSHHLYFTHLILFFRTVGRCRQTVREVHGTYKVKNPCCKGVPGQDCTNFFVESLETACLRRLVQEWPLGRVAWSYIFCGRDVSNCVGEKTVMFKKLLVSQLVKIFTLLYGTWRFITDYTTAHNVTCPHSEPDKSSPLSKKMCTT